MQPHRPSWTLDELGAQVALALAVDYSGAANGRVRDVPDRRTIRYYTTLGLLDRPAATRGRTALYGRRHLLQLVAIKRLQAGGLSLAGVQERLLGLTDAALEKIARLPPAAGGAPAPAERARGGGRRDQPFWGETPAPVPPLDEPAPPRPLVGVPLAEGVTLLLGAARPPDEHDLEALRVAAAPLLRLLRARRLVDGGGGRPSTKGETS
jgi:hypothetical protein